VDPRPELPKINGIIAGIIAETGILGILGRPESPGFWGVMGIWGEEKPYVDPERPPPELELEPPPEELELEPELELPPLLPLFPLVSHHSSTTPSYMPNGRSRYKHRFGIWK